MQFKFVTAFVLMGLCLIQATSAHPSHTDLQQRSLIDDLLNKAKEAIEQLTALIQQKVNEALETLKELQDKVMQLANQSIEAMKQQLLAVIEKAKQAIEEIKKKAEQAGIDISDCIAQNNDKFQELFEKFLADEVKCVTGEVEEVLRIIKEAVDMVTNALDTIKKLPNDLNDCTKNSKPITCISNLLLNVAKLQKDLPAQIVKKVQEVTQFVTGLKVRLEACATTQLVNAGVATAGIVADVAKCAADKGVEQLHL